MPQLPIQADGLQIEPGSGQTLTITRDPITGSLRLRDHVVTGGINLVDLAGLSAVAGVHVVGKSGTGAKYTSIQDAFDAVPADASAANPHVVLVFPGVYSENLILEKDGVSLVAVGKVVLTAPAAQPTLLIQESVSTAPRTFLAQGVWFENLHNGEECVLITGGTGSTLGEGGLEFRDCNFAAAGVGGYTVRADAVNHLRLVGCVADDSSATAALRVSQCASLLVDGGSLPLVQADYSSAGAIPSEAGSDYWFVGCRSIGNMMSTLSGAGSIQVLGCPSMGNLLVNGDRTGLIQDSTLGNVIAGGTTALTLRRTRRGSTAGTGTLDETFMSGSVAFVGSVSETVVFSIPRSNDNYTVALETGVLSASRVTAKTAAGFTIEFGSMQTTTVSWSVLAGS